MKRSVWWRGCLVCCVVSVGAWACQKNAPPDVKQPAPAATSPVDAGSVDSDMVRPAAATSPARPEPSTSATTEDGLVYAAIGCPLDRITPEGCKVCPSGVLWEGVEPYEDVAIELTRGKRYSEAKGEHVMAVFSRCQDVAGQVITDYVHLVRGDDQKWEVQSIASLDDVKACEAVNGFDGLTRHMCHSEGGRMGFYPVEHYALTWSKTEAREDTTVESPVRTLLVSGVYTAGCEHNYMIGDSVKKSVKDVDDVSVLTLNVIHDEGPYEGDLSECFDGEFEAPLTPKRTKKSSSRTLEYKPTPDGYVESSGQSALVEISEDYAQFVD